MCSVKKLFKRDTVLSNQKVFIKKFFMQTNKSSIPTKTKQTNKQKYSNQKASKKGTNVWSIKREYTHGKKKKRLSTKLGALRTWPQLPLSVSVCLSVSLPVTVSVCLSVCLSRTHTH